MLIFYVGSILIIQVYSKPIHDDTIVHFGHVSEHPAKHHAGKGKALPSNNTLYVNEDSPYQVDTSTTGCRWKKHNRDCSGHYYSRHHHVSNRKLNCGFGMGTGTMHRYRCGSNHHVRVPVILDHRHHKCGYLHHAGVHHAAVHVHHAAATHHTKAPVHHAGDLVHHVGELVHHVVLDGHPVDSLADDLPAQLDRADARIASHAADLPEHTVTTHRDPDPLLASVLNNEAHEAHHGVVSDHPDIVTDGTDHFEHVDDEPAHESIAAEGDGVAAANAHDVPVITGIGLTNMAGTLTTHAENFPEHAVVDNHIGTAATHTNALHGGYTDGALDTSVDVLAAPVLTRIATTRPHTTDTLAMEPTNTEVLPDHAVFHGHIGNTHTISHNGGHEFAPHVVTHVGPTLTVAISHTEVSPVHAESGTNLYPEHERHHHPHIDVANTHTGDIPSITDAPATDSVFYPVHTGILTEHPLVGIGPTEVLPEDLGILTHGGDDSEHAGIPTDIVSPHKW